MAKTGAHIKAGVDFARTNNVRLLIRNTGHDFMGRSTGFGSLAINTHSFKTVTFVKNYTGGGGYTGSAVTVGAGVQVRELYKLANAQSPKVVVVGGECPTVGLAGGYIQGGGHGPMVSDSSFVNWTIMLTISRLLTMAWVRTCSASSNH